MVIATTIASSELHGAYEPMIRLPTPLRILALFGRMLPSAILAGAMLPHQSCAWFEGLFSLDAEFETTPKNGSTTAAPARGQTVAAALPVPQPLQVATMTGDPAMPHSLAGAALQAAPQPLPRPVQRARVHWYVYAELVFVGYQLCWVAYFLRCAEPTAAWGAAFPALAVGTLCCFYGDQVPFRTLTGALPHHVFPPRAPPRAATRVVAA